ncbi:hypothetical protein M9H77_31760 [Catharanthus roseus]|uniref:Uncharacterized protein n=1 Tax=Catharanthus roseus TaxID=4058 RepID=A0ACC0A3B7_CATRO|nr:hypothetical protein M9H77_31760 [Catharanthus roseus]
MKTNTYLIINRYQRSNTADRRSYVTLACERGGAVKKTPKPIVDPEEEEVPIKMRGPYGTKKCDCPFKLKGEQMATSDNWQLLFFFFRGLEPAGTPKWFRHLQLFIHDERHTHKIGVYNHIRKSYVPPRNILQFFREQNVGYAVRYNMPLLEAVGMTPTGKNFIVAAAFTRNE